ncbi:sugar phosphate nucleotidyltransferase [Salipiger marinus]|uniref:Glucose-1-phosphate adenylyltransferase n=1 Tax=Salipiger marinus TaxID=555512 RepID=A0A1G8SME0_9RHOB|nr:MULTISPECIES: sugar phosphate nucleotidyltransferase [Salipiger]MEB3420734.1 sugar phosphate nucleotidyltransferase [Salipiger manganoxidans]SDJ29885.1 glucose-1-phosphate adenylyltransferase [Salipiger marinus]
MTLETVDTKACLPFLLAGGRGSRLYELTDSECKPAIPFAGQCRIVDFILAATRDAGFTGLIAATQYEPDTLHAHLGSTWAPQFRRGIAVRDGRNLPAPGFVGTAAAVTACIDIIDLQAPRELMVLAGDHVTDIDLGALLVTHRQTGAAATVAVTPVPRAEARAFGVLAAEASGRVTAFVEKPQNPPAMPGDPQRALASMGIYVFDWKWLRAALIADAMRAGSSHDFGHDLLPKAMAEGLLQVHTLPAHADGTPGYWRDVGTLDAYRQCQLDFFQRPPMRLPNLTAPTMRRPALASSWAHDDTGSVALPGAQAGRGCRLHRVILGRGACLPDGTVIGEDAEEDQRWFRRTPGGTTLVTRAMLARRAEARARLYPVSRPDSVRAVSH